MFVKSSLSFIFITRIPSVTIGVVVVIVASQGIVGLAQGGVLKRHSGLQESPSCIYPSGQLHSIVVVVAPVVVGVVVMIVIVGDVVVNGLVVVVISGIGGVV